MVKIGISTDGNSVAPHFGRCPEYTLVTIEDGRVIAKEKIPNPGHEPGFLPKYLGDMGVTLVIAGGMGPRAQGLFDERNIKTIIGISGRVDDVLEAFIAGTLESGESTCEHH